MKIMNVGYKEEKPKGSVEEVKIVDGDEGKMCYPTMTISAKELKSIVDLEQDGFYNVSGYVRISQKSTGDKERYNGGGDVTLEFRKIGFEPAKKKKVEDMSEEELTSGETEVEENDEYVKKG